MVDPGSPTAPSAGGRCRRARDAQKNIDAAISQARESHPGKPVEVWRNKNMRTYLGTCVLWKGALYGFDDKQLRCLDWQTGEVRWTRPETGLGSLILADGKLIALQENGTLLVVEATAEACRILAQARVLSGRCWTVPALAGGRLFLRNAVGDVLCVDVCK